MQDKAENHNVLSDAEEQAQRARLEFTEPLLRTFVEGYLTDVGVGAHMIEAYAFDHPDSQLDIVKYLSALVDDVIDIESGFDLEKVIGGGASLLLLVEIAKRVTREVIPLHLIPSEAVLEVIMQLFHSGKGKAED